MSDEGLTSTLTAIHEETQAGEHINIGDLIDALNSRGYGPLLIAPALITLLPTGAIPGVPAVCAALIGLISIQILMGSKQPWLPQKLKDFSFSRGRFMKTVNKVKPLTRKIDRLFHPRLEFLVRHEIQPVIAILCLLLAVSIIILGWIPFLAMIPASAILLMGLGLSTHDGLLIAIALVFTTGSFAALSSILFHMIS